MIIDILLRVLWTKSVVCTSLVVECHILCRTKILREFLSHIETCIGIGLNLETINLTTLSSDKDCALSTLGTIENYSLCTLKEGNLLDLRRKYIVRWTLYTVDDNEWQVIIVISVKKVMFITIKVCDVIFLTPEITAIPSTNESVQVIQTTHGIILLPQFLHIDIGNTSEKMVGILVAESNMDFLFYHSRISIVSSLGISRHWRSSQHGKEKYVCFNMFHNL